MYQSVIMTDIVGKERLSVAFGFLTLFQGVGVTVGPPIAGIYIYIYIYIYIHVIIYYNIY